MYAHAKHLLSHRLAASALVGIVALGVLAVLPAREIAARTAAERNTVSGRAHIIDGDTIGIGGVHVRLEGIDAPEHGQTCRRRNFETWKCGEAAGEALRALIANRIVSCDGRGRDKYGRMLGICYVDGRDINAEMVREGFAWAFVKYSKSYVREEAEARAAQAGIWTGEAQPAWLYREQRWAGAASDAPAGCAIKGNINAREHVYYTPWSPGYAAVKIDETKGERWFCSEAEAIAEGWRPASVQ